MFTLMGSILASAIAGTAVLRDFEFKTHELLFTTRLRKSSVRARPLLGAYVVTVLVLACSALGLWLGCAPMPWLDPDKIGAARPGTYLCPVLVFYVVPNTLAVRQRPVLRRRRALTMASFAFSDLTVMAQVMPPSRSACCSTPWWCGRSPGRRSPRCWASGSGGRELIRTEASAPARGAEIDVPA